MIALADATVDRRHPRTAPKNWGLKQEHISQQYTTNLLEVIKEKG